MAWWKSTVLQALRNCGSSVSALISDGSSFHQAGARAEKALALVDARQMSWWLGISSRFAPDERKVIRGGYGERQSLRYVGLGPHMALKVNTRILNLIQNFTGSQCSCWRIGRICAFHGVPVSTQAAAFCTSCNFRVQIQNNGLPPSGLNRDIAFLSHYRNLFHENLVNL